MELKQLKERHAQRLQRQLNLVHKYKCRESKLLGVLAHIETKCAGYDGYDTVSGLKTLVDTIVQIITDSEPIQSVFDDQSTQLQKYKEAVEKIKADAETMCRQNLIDFCEQTLQREE